MLFPENETKTGSIKRNTDIQDDILSEKVSFLFQSKLKKLTQQLISKLLAKNQELSSQRQLP